MKIFGTLKFLGWSSQYRSPVNWISLTIIKLNVRLPMTTTPRRIRVTSNIYGQRCFGKLSNLFTCSNICMKSPKLRSASCIGRTNVTFVLAASRAPYAITREYGWLTQTVPTCTRRNRLTQPDGRQLRNTSAKETFEPTLFGRAGHIDSSRRPNSQGSISTTPTYSNRH